MSSAHYDLSDAAYGDKGVRVDVVKPCFETTCILACDQYTPDDTL